LGVPERFKTIQEEHERIVQALEKGNPKLAEEAVRHHVEQARVAYFKSLEQWGA
jgi:DNA-binding GntR family transcriptional regulator